MKKRTVAAIASSMAVVAPRILLLVQVWKIPVAFFLPTISGKPSYNQKYFRYWFPFINATGATISSFPICCSVSNYKPFYSKSMLLNSS